MSRARTRRSSPLQRLPATLLAAAILAVIGAAAAYALSRADLASIGAGTIPRLAYDAYQRASAAAPDVAAGCTVDWTILAGIARIESRHGLIDGTRSIAPNGEVTPWIRGRSLDGTGGTRPIPDTDGGALDGDVTWDRAMGPFQFIPTTWAELGRDGNGDGVADPDNLNDAALTAVAHLCLREPGNYADRGELRRALVAYNASGRYADDVLRWVERYRNTAIEDLLAD